MESQGGAVQPHRPRPSRLNVMSQLVQDTHHRKRCIYSARGVLRIRPSLCLWREKAGPDREYPVRRSEMPQLPAERDDGAMPSGGKA